MNRSGGQPRIPLPLLAGGLLLAAGYAACAKTSPPQKPTIHTTKAFDDLFGELPPLPIPAPCYAAVVFFPSAATPGAYRAVPVFSLEQGKEERLAVRTVVEGIETEGGGPVDELLREIRRPFPDHSRFTSREIGSFMERCIERDMELVVTTEKDAVRFPRPKEITVPIWFLRIEVEILKGHEAWEEMIDRFCHPHAPGDPVLRFRDAYAI